MLQSFLGNEQSSFKNKFSCKVFPKMIFLHPPSLSHNNLQLMSTQLNLDYRHLSYGSNVKAAFSFHRLQPLSLVHSPDKLFLALMCCTSYKSCEVAPCTAPSSRRPGQTWETFQGRKSARQQIGSYWPWRIQISFIRSLHPSCAALTWVYLPPNKQRIFSEGWAGDVKPMAPASVTVLEKLPAFVLVQEMLQTSWSSCMKGWGTSRVVNGLVDLWSSGHLTFPKSSFVAWIVPSEEWTKRWDFRIELLEQSGVLGGSDKK